MRISDWSSDVCSSDLVAAGWKPQSRPNNRASSSNAWKRPLATWTMSSMNIASIRSEEHTSELQSLMRISYAVFCLKKKNKNILLQNVTQIIAQTETTKDNTQFIRIQNLMICIN